MILALPYLPALDQKTNTLPEPVNGKLTEDSDHAIVEHRPPPIVKQVECFLYLYENNTKET